MPHQVDSHPIANPRLAPEYALHRQKVTAPDALPETKHTRGINMTSHTQAHIQVVPTGGANPTVAVLWWSTAAGKFVQEHVPISRAGVGADTPFEFTIESHGRIMFVAVTAIVAGETDVFVSGYNVERV